MKKMYNENERVTTKWKDQEITKGMEKLKNGRRN